MALVTAKSSTIFIGTRDGTQVYHSVDDVPAPLRRRLRETTQAPTSATILIADKRGREELIRALQGEPSNVQCRLAETIRTRNSQRTVQPKRKISNKLVRRWLEFLLPAAIGVSLWLLADSHF